MPEHRFGPVEASVPHGFWSQCSCGWRTPFCAKVSDARNKRERHALDLVEGRVWWVLKDGITQGTHTLKRHALESVAASSAQRLGPGIYQAGDYIVTNIEPSQQPEPDAASA